MIKWGTKYSGLSDARKPKKKWKGLVSDRLPRNIQDRALRKLRQLDAALTMNDLRNPPSNHLEKLRGDRKGQMSLRINNQWRICFRWIDNEAEEIEIVDYH